MNHRTLRFTSFAALLLIATWSPADANRGLVTKVYPVADLLPGSNTTIVEPANLGIQPLPGSNTTIVEQADLGIQPSVRPGTTDNASQKQELSALTSLLREELLANDKNATIEDFWPNQTVVVTTSPSVHKTLESQLALLRAYRKLLRAHHTPAAP